MVSKKRARSSEAKRIRRESIIAAAARLLSKAGADGLRMDDVAREAGVAKGTLYLYFKQRADVLLAVSERATLDWLHAVDDLVRPDLRRRGDATLAEAFVSPLRRNPEIIGRVAFYPGAYAGATAELRAQSRAAFMLTAHRLGDLIESRLTGSRRGSGLRVVLFAEALLIGSAHVSTLAADSAELDPAEAATAFDVAADFERLLRAVMAGSGTVRPVF